MDMPGMDHGSATTTTTALMATTTTAMAVIASTVTGVAAPATTTMHMMSSMEMTFVVSQFTPLFATVWKPKSLGQYVGTCVFLIVLGFLYRFLVAFKAVQENSWAISSKELNEHLIINVVQPGDAGSELEIGGVGFRVPESKGSIKGWGGRPWRGNVDLVRAALTTLNVGVGYLL